MSSEEICEVRLSKDNHKGDFRFFKRSERNNGRRQGRKQNTNSFIL